MVKVEVIVMNSEMTRELSRDLRSLYCNLAAKGLSVSSQVEDMFIKVAAASQGAFENWLEKNYRNRGRLGLNNVAHYEALTALARLNRQLHGDLSLPDIVTTYGSSIIWAVQNLALADSDPDVARMLAPYSAEIEVFKKIQVSQVIENPMAAKEDLKIIEDAFEESEAASRGDLPEKKLTKKQQKMMMFQNLLARFSEEIASAANRSGNKELAQRIMNEALLAKPMVIAKYLSKDIDKYLINESNRIIKFVLSNLGPDAVDPNFQHAKEQILNFIGLVSNEELLNIRTDRQEALDMSLLGPGEVKGLPSASGLPSLQVSKEQWMNPNTLLLTSLFLGLLFSKISG